MNFFLKIFKLLPPELAHSISLNSLNILYNLGLVRLFSKQILINDDFNFLGMNFVVESHILERNKLRYLQEDIYLVLYLYDQ